MTDTDTIITKYQVLIQEARQENTSEAWAKVEAEKTKREKTAKAIWYCMGGGLNSDAFHKFMEKLKGDLEDEAMEA